MRNSIILELLAFLVVISLADDNCGIPKIKPKFINTTNEDIGQIVGGEEAFPHSYPWMIR